MDPVERIDEFFNRGPSDDWRFPAHISREEWLRMSPGERSRLSDEAFAKRRDTIFARVRAEHPDWPEAQIVYEALFELYEGDIDPDFLRGAAAHIAKRAAERGQKACAAQDGGS